MSNQQSCFVCENCGEEYLKWQGKCDSCHEWNVLKEFKVKNTKTSKEDSNSVIKSIVEIKNEKYERISTGNLEFDRVLGNEINSGGLVQGSVVLLGGDPGIGKSTILLQLASYIGDVLYVSGEESENQIKMRFERLGLKVKEDDNKNIIRLLVESNIDIVIKMIEKDKPKVVIIDSIQTVYTSEYPSSPGSIIQVKECAFKLQKYAKANNTTVILVGHVTKEGQVAGPKTLEHLVDVVLYLEGERYQNIRILKGIKNRYGATDEIGIFEMNENGLKQVENISEIFLSNHSSGIPGSVVTSVMEGTRSFVVEVQALTNTTNFGYPQRRANGFDVNRLQVLIAVLQKRANINLENQDIFVNIAGGIKIKEPSADLAIMLAIASAYKNKSIDRKYCIFGEVGLTGEIRKVTFESKRIAESNRLGFLKNVQSKNIGLAIKEVLEERKNV